MSLLLSINPVKLRYVTAVMLDAILPTARGKLTLRLRHTRYKYTFPQDIKEITKPHFEYT